MSCLAAGWSSGMGCHHGNVAMVTGKAGFLAVLFFMYFLIGVHLLAGIGSELHKDKVNLILFGPEVRDHRMVSQNHRT